MNVHSRNDRTFVIWFLWWIPVWFVFAWLLGWCAGQAACPAVAAPAAAPDASTCSTTCPENRVCSGNECLYPCSNSGDCEAIGDPRIPVCSPSHVCVAGRDR